MTAADLDAIAQSSRRNNAARGLTGLLLHGGGRFYGVFEGQSRRVLARMEIIITDPRHRNLSIVREDAVRESRFATWSFGSMADGADQGLPHESLEAFILGLAGRL